MPEFHKRGALVGGVAILIYFLVLAHGGLGAWFSGDDVVNISFLHGYGQKSFPVLIAEALAVFTPAYRPTGGVYYRVLYAIFGLNATPFRIIFFALLLINLVLAAIWIRRVTGSQVAAFVGALVLSYHSALNALYYNDGTIYDVLCLFFLLLILIGYRKCSTFTLALLFGAALGSKEMAATFPAMLFLYELLFGERTQPWRQRFRPVLVLSAMAVVCMAIKIGVPNQMSTNDLYWPRHDLAFIAENYLAYHRMLFFAPHLSGVVLIVILVTAAIAAVALRSRIMAFGLTFALVTMLPVATIPVRGGFVLYIPLLGYALYLASLKWTAAPAAVFAVLMFWLQITHPRPDEPLVNQEQNLKTLLASARTAAPSLPPASRVLLLNDPFPRIAWETLFVLRLGYQDPALWVDRTPQTDPSIYALTLTWDGKSYKATKQDRVDSAAQLSVPVNVRRGDTYNVTASPALASCAIDAAYRMPDDELARAGIWHSWTTLDASGKGAAQVHQDAERGLVVIDHLRACGKQWVPTSASFTVFP